MGVRSSWLMFARNWLLASLAASAAALASSSDSSARLRSVISLKRIATFSTFRPADPKGRHLVPAIQRLGLVLKARRFRPSARFFHSFSNQCASWSGARPRINFPWASCNPVCLSNAGLISRKR